VSHPLAEADPRRRAAPMHVARGALIGVAEVVPGISGGTVALVVGLYGTLINSAGHLLTALRHLVRGRREQAREAHAEVRWIILVPVAVGMLTALVIAAQLLEPVLEEHPVGSRAVFAGMILVSLLVPARMVGRWTPREVALAHGGLVAGVLLTGLPPGTVAEPPLLLVTAAAAVAICALVLPGVSGSFLLLTVGLYAPTLAALNDRNVPYIAAFALGAFIGLGAFVKLLQHLLHHHAAVTLSVMTGLMAGSLRALWPWQDGDRTLLAPGSDLWPVTGLALLGAAAVITLLVVETRVARRREDDEAAQPAQV